MDIPRPNAIKERRRRQAIIGGVVLLVLVGVTLGVARLKPAAPSVDRSTVFSDTVKRGSMQRQVRGLGTLVPEDIRWIPAVTEGRVDRIVLLPGTQVKADSILLELSNPQLQQEALDAEWKVKSAEADLRSLQTQLQSQVLSQKADAAKASADYNEARMRAETDAELNKLGVISDLNLKVSKGHAQELSTRNEIEQQRYENSSKVLEAQVAAKRADLEQLRAMYQLKEQQVNQLKVRAGTNGVLQELPLKVGQFVTAGTTLAKVVQPEKLKAELRVPETQAKDVQLGLPATIDTRNGLVNGKVTRIDPAAQNGTVTVDVSLDGALPPGARPDLSVDGTINLETLKNVLYIGRPAFGQDNSTVGMFKIDPDGTATRVQVRLGRSSVNNVEVLDGLREGDQVILSDMSRWDNFDRIKLQ